MPREDDATDVSSSGSEETKRNRAIRKWHPHFLDQEGSGSDQDQQTASAGIWGNFSESVRSQESDQDQDQELENQMEIAPSRKETREEILKGCWSSDESMDSTTGYGQGQPASTQENEFSTSQDLFERTLAGPALEISQETWDDYYNNVISGKEVQKYNL